MAKGQWVGVNGVARKVKNKYVGVGGVARKVKAGWVGVAGVARQYFGGISYKFVEYKGSSSYIKSVEVSAGVSGSNWAFSVTATLSRAIDGGQPQACVQIENTDLAGKTLSMSYQTQAYTQYTGAFIYCFDSAGASTGYWDISDQTSKTVTIPANTVMIQIGVEVHKDGTNTRTLTVSSLTIGETKLL